MSDLYVCAACWWAIDHAATCSHCGTELPPLPEPPAPPPPPPAPPTPPRNYTLEHELLGATPPPHITDNAACKGIDPALFYPGRGHSVTEAKAVCEGCPVKAECLEWALDNGEKYGIWGGLSERERRRIRRDRNDAHGLNRRLKERCVRGHQLTGDNVRTNPDGSRRCITCQREANREAHLRRQGAA